MSKLTDEQRMRNLLARYGNQWHRMGELWERCQGKGWPKAESEEFARLRDELTPATRALLLAYAHPAPQQKPLTVTEDQAWNLARYVYAHSNPHESPQILLSAQEIKQIIEAAHNIGEKK